jgi:ABC-type uncharacterized transport system auxiliary subunit
MTPQRPFPDPRPAFRPRPRSGLAALVAAALLLAGCMTVNHLDRYDFENARLAVDLHTPPEPQLRIDYNFQMNDSPVISALRVMSNLAKANQASRARDLMRHALMEVDVPGIVRSESFRACASSLGTSQVDSIRQADYVLALHIDEWGIEARSPVAVVTLHMKLLASIYPRTVNELAWRREITVDQPAEPDMFGVGTIIGNMVTATVLYDMTREDLERGFRELASMTARRIAYELEGDLDRARFGG